MNAPSTASACPRSAPLPAANTGPAPLLDAPHAPHDPLFGHWLLAHREVLFRWTLARANEAGTRRVFAAAAVSIQRLRGCAGFDHWLYGAAVQSAAAAQGLTGGLPEACLAGLAPELRTVLRLVARGALRTQEAQALLPQHLSYVRNRLLAARMGSAGHAGRS